MQLRTAFVTAAAVLLAVPAAASANPYTPTEVCGSSYRVVHSHHIRGDAGGILGTSYLLWSSRTKKNCAVTIKRRAVGIPTWMRVRLAREGSPLQTDDSGYEGYRYYAGPLYVRAPGQCVIYGGGMHDARGNGGVWITPRPVACD